MADIIAIDGPSASGKSTVARKVAEALGYTYVNSGAIYRAVAWKADLAGLNPSDRESLIKLLSALDLTITDRDCVMVISVDGEEPGDLLHTEHVSTVSSAYAAIPEVRRFVVDCLRSLAGTENLVVEGRDIGSVVFPDASMKIYLDASPEERARRRQAELAGRDEAINIAAVASSLQERDLRDSNREIAPLSVADDAIVVDTTGHSIDESVASVIKLTRNSK